MHGRGLIEKVFGRPIPVILHELEYFEAVARRTELANPAGPADEFARWVRGG
ncbi:hypothetical protein [Streptomyces sp. NPDC048269]|uniref:hypothetical protein n=1 Tax=Streptomyces sp. NPDC048269 TaxID=3155753 RepID=UPI0034163880